MNPALVLGVGSIGTRMDLNRMIAELRDEKQRLDEAIEALERLSMGTAKRRGRPPKWIKALGDHAAALPEKAVLAAPRAK